MTTFHCRLILVFSLPLGLLFPLLTFKTVIMADSIMKLANICIIVPFQFCCEFQPKTWFVKPIIAFWKFTTHPIGCSWCYVIWITVFAPPFLKKVTMFWIIMVQFLTAHVRFRRLGKRCYKVGKGNREACFTCFCTWAFLSLFHYSSVVISQCHIDCLGLRCGVECWWKCAYPHSSGGTKQPSRPSSIAKSVWANSPRGT